MKLISVLLKRPGQIPRHVNISNSLAALQRNVGGYIEAITYAHDCVIICNEEGLLRGMPYNCTIAGCDFVGDIIIAGRNGDEFADLPLTWDECKQIFPELWRTP